MPELSGFDVMSFVRQTPGLEHTRILVVSGLEQSELDRAISEGADAALPKPFGNKELVSKVKELMQPLVQSAGGVPG